MTLARRMAVSISIVLPVLLVSVYSYLQIRNNTVERIYEERRSLVSLSAHVLKEKLDRLNDIGLSFSTRPVLCQYVDEQKWDAAIALMKQVPKDFAYIDHIVLTDTAGTLRADVPNSPGVIGMSYAQSDWYKVLAKTRQPYLSEVYIRAENIVAAFALPVRNKAGNVRGILVLRVRVAELLEWSKDVSIGNSGFVYVVDHKGHIAASPEYANADSVIDYSSVPAVQKALKGERNVEVLYNPIAKEIRLSAYEQVPGYRWAVIVQQESSAALSADKNLQLVFVLYAVVALLAVISAYFISREMNRRATTEEVLRQKTEELDRYFTHALDLLCIADMNGCFRRLNREWESSLGYSLQDLEGKPFLDFVHPDDIKATLVAMADLGEGKTVLRFTNRYRHKDGSYRWIEWRSFPAGNLIYASARDITERKQAEGKLLQNSEKLEAANKELDAFSYSVSHDLRAPLRHVSGFIDLLHKHAAGALDEKAKRYLSLVVDSVKEMGVLIDDLLGFSRMGRTAMQESRINLRALVDEVVRGLEQETEGRIIDWRIEQLPEVNGDPPMLRLVVANLLSNALKYSRTRETAIIEIGAKDGNDEHVFFVHDNGVGFDMRYYDKLFGVFQRLHSSKQYEGTGIGLANVRRIIARHGGRTWAESELNKGATFYFSLPTNQRKS